MKMRIILALIMGLMFMAVPSVIVLAQEVTAVETDQGSVTGLGDIYLTFSALAVGTVTITEFLKKLLGKVKSTPDWAILALSWGTGLLLTMAGFFLKLGFLADVGAVQALIYGLAASLAANGLADTKILQAIIDKLFQTKK